jgi:hypothetical protein
MKNQLHMGFLLSLSVVAMMLASACGNDLDTLLQGGDCGPGCDLAGADLSNRNLGKADLSGANLTGFEWPSADLTGANLTNADLRWTNLKEVNLTDADFSAFGPHWAVYESELPGGTV